LCFKPPHRLAASKHLTATLSEITNGAAQHWKSVSSSYQVQIVSEYTEHLQLLYAIDVMCVYAGITPNDMPEVVEDIDPRFD
jgi:hypothetical protein